jgi:hypothetical protein
MMEERGFERKQAKVHSVSCKAWIGVRLKEHDEMVTDATDQEEGKGPDHQEQNGIIKPFPIRKNLTTAFKNPLRSVSH